MSDTALFLLFMVPGTFFLGVHDIFVRRVLRGGAVSEQLLLGFQFSAVAAILAIPLFFVTGIPEIKPGFWTAILTTAGLNIFANWAWYAAFKREEASLISPLRLLSPVITIFTGYFVLREIPTAGGVAGILTMVAGLWFLLQSEATWRAAPLRDVVRRPGILLGLWGAVSFGLSFPFDKRAVVTGSSLLVAVVGFSMIGVASVAMAFLRGMHAGERPRLHMRENWRFLAVMPFIHSISTYLTFTALSYALAAYAVSVKRLWSFWAVLLSGRFLKERNIGRKFLATLAMLGGIALIVFFG